MGGNEGEVIIWSIDEKLKPKPVVRQRLDSIEPPADD
jgi:hypothetical protein